MTRPDIFFWSSTSRNTQRFVENICKGREAGLRIGASSSDRQIASRPYVLIVPTYAAHDGRGAVPKPVIRFLNDPVNRSFLKGVIGSGNRNFGEMFCFGAKVIAQKCDVPILHRFELAGTQRDIDIVSDGLDHLLARLEQMDEPAACPA